MAVSGWFSSCASAAAMSAAAARRSDARSASSAATRSSTMAPSRMPVALSVAMSTCSSKTVTGWYCPVCTATISSACTTAADQTAPTAPKRIEAQTTGTNRK